MLFAPVLLWSEIIAPYLVVGYRKLKARLYNREIKYRKIQSRK